MGKDKSETVTSSMCGLGDGLSNNSSSIQIELVFYFKIGLFTVYYFFEMIICYN